MMQTFQITKAHYKTMECTLYSESKLDFANYIGV